MSTAIPDTEAPTQAPAPASHRKHHPTSPSTLQTREVAPCWIPRGGTSEAAERGTLQHDAADAETIPDELTDAESTAVLEVLDMVDKYKASPEHGPDAEVLKEHKWPIDDEKVVDLDGDVWTGSTAGFADVVIASPSTGFADVMDWKFGKNAVEPAKTNTQGIAYALGVVHVFSKRGVRIRAVRVTFYSPHIKDITQHTFTESEFPAMRLRLRRIVSRALATQKAIAKDPGNLKNYTPSIPGCMFCGRLGTCEAVGQLGFEVSKKYKPMSVPETDVNFFDLTDESVARLALGLSDTLTEWGKAVRQRVTQYAVTHPEWEPDGYRLMTTFPRKVVDADAVVTVATEEFGVPKDVIDKARKLPLTPLETYIKANAARGQKDAAVESFGARLDEVGATQKSLTPTISLRIVSRRNVDQSEK